ncbi:restriction endonuclease subunit S [Synechococcus sp. CS-1328]|uniref:restriction endonuclease subunit S n=1 Tax=Synechococcus sp. CS-1328 TaxID=2847976 RepID=UPI00223BB257|nr:restriction endonuclease subunit S [Synechococcus sp. CS-1328]MCT0224112.1 restriction endonuclease subunit S [Synechococcus sp. CS-1328]
MRWDGVKRWPFAERGQYSTYELREDDVVLAMDRPWIEAGLKYATISKHDLPCLLVQRTARLRGGPNLDTRFLRYLIGSREFTQHIHAITTGTAVPHISGKQIKDFKFLLPLLPEQKAIAAVLGALDDKIELNRRMNATLEAMARALFQSWFVDFDPVRAKLDGLEPFGLDPDTAALFPEHFEDSRLGKKPIGWQVTKLDSVLAVLETGGRPKGGVGGITSGVPSIGAESIVSVGVFDFGKTKFVPVEFYEEMKRGHIESYDVLLYKDGGCPGEYEPHVSMFGDGFPFVKCSINEHVYRLRTNDHLSQEYLYFWMTSEFAFAEMRIKGTGVAIPGLNSTAVRSLAVLVPPPTIVEAFTEQAAPLVSRILSNAKQSRTLANLRDTLLPKFISGEVRAPSAVLVEMNGVI